MERTSVRSTTIPRTGPPLWHAGVLVPAALVLAIVSPTLIGNGDLGGLTAPLRLAAQGLAMAFALRGWFQADQADVGPSVQDENLRILLVLGGLIAAMFAGALGWLAFMDVLSSV